MGSHNKYNKPLLFMLMSSAIILGSYSVLNKKVLLTVDGQTVKFNTLSRSVESFLINENINIEQGCRITPPIETKLKDNVQIKITNPYEVKITDGSEELVYKTNQETVGDILKEFNIKLNSKDTVNKKLDQTLKENEDIVITRIEEKIKKEVVEVPFEVQYIEDTRLVEGYIKQEVKGQIGKKEVKYKIMYKNGVPVTKEKISEDILIKPIKEVIRKGKLKVNSL